MVHRIWIDVGSEMFNANIFSAENCLRLLQLRPGELRTVSDTIEYTGPMARHSYSRLAMTEKYIVLRLLERVAMEGMNQVFSIISLVMSDIFWESLKTLEGRRNDLISMPRMDLLSDRAELYECCVFENGAPLQSFIGLLEGTKVFMARFGVQL